jgi:hypothetical protein
VVPGLAMQGPGPIGLSPPHHLNSHSLGGLISATAVRWRKNFGSLGKSRNRSVNISSLRSSTMASHHPFSRLSWAKPDLVAKAAQLMGLKVYKTSSPDVTEVAKKLPVGQLYATGRAFVPNIRQALYSDVIVALAGEPQQAAVGPNDDKASTPVARGLPRNWDEIAPGHLVDPVVLEVSLKFYPHHT